MIALLAIPVVVGGIIANEIRTNRKARARIAEGYYPATEHNFTANEPVHGYHALVR